MKKIDPKGQVIIFVTLSFMLLGLFVGMAIDFGRGYLERARISRTVDAVALAAARALQGQSGLQSQAVTAGCGAAAMNGVSNCGQTSPLGGSAVGCAAGSFTVSLCFVDKVVTGGPPMNFVQVSGYSSIPTTFLRLLTFVGAGDYTTLPVGAVAEGGPERPVDLMLVLDRSGSMTQTDGTGTSKLDALKCALTGAGCGGVGLLDQAFSGTDRIGMTSFGRRGCGTEAGAEFGGDTCVPNVPMDFMTGGQKTTLENAIDGLPPSGTTNTMEGLRTAITPLSNAVADPTRATSRKAVILVTDGQPTAVRMDNTLQCKVDPVNYPATSGFNLTNQQDNFSDSGCYFVKRGNSTSVGVSNGLTRFFLNNTEDTNFCDITNNDPSCQQKKDQNKQKDINPSIGTGNTLYHHMMWAARNAARDEANALRNLGGGNVVIFVIAIGEPTPTDVTARLDANARCLLGLIANDPTVINDPSTNQNTGGCAAGAVHPTPTDGDPHTDLTQTTPGSTPRAFQSGQQVGKLYTVNMSNVTTQLQTIFADIAAILKLRLTV